MIKLSKCIQIALCIALIIIFTAACGGRKTIKETMTEDQFNLAAGLCRNHGLTGDFQPGKVVCVGDIDGKAAVVDVVPQIVDGNIHFQIVAATADGAALDAEKYAELNADMAKEIKTPPEGYAVTAVEINDTEMVVTLERK